MIDDGFFQINDIVLNIPPTQIKVSRNSFDHRVENLRSVGASVVKSKFSELSIQVSAVFTGNKKQLDGNKAGAATGLLDLQNLIAQFRTTPFCYVKNKFLSEAIFSQRVSSPMVLAIRNVNISVIAENSVDVVRVIFGFNFFNHLAYVDEFRYRTSVFAPINENTLDPRESEAWRMFYEAEKIRRKSTGSPYTSLNHLTDSDGSQMMKMKMSFRQFQMFRAPELKRRKEEIKALRTEGSDPAYEDFKGSIEERARRLGGDAFNSNERYSKDYRIATVEETLDVMRHERQTSMLNRGGVYLTEDELIAASQRWEIFAENLPEGWEAILLKDGNFSVLSSDPKTTTVMDATTKSGADDLVLCTKIKKLDFDKMDINPVGVNINFSNRLAPIPLISSMYPTYQHMGGTDVTANISFLTTSNEDVEDLARFHTIWKEQKIYMRSIPTSFQKVTIQNDILNMCGLHSFQLQNMEIGTVPGQPETKQIVFELMENAKPDFSEEKLVYEETRQGHIRNKYANKVFKWMNDYLLRPGDPGAYSNWDWQKMFSEDIIGGRISKKKRKGKIQQQLLKDPSGNLISQGAFSKSPGLGDMVHDPAAFPMKGQEEFIDPYLISGISEVTKEVIYTLAPGGEAPASDPYHSSLFIRGVVDLLSTEEVQTRTAPFPLFVKRLLTEFNILFSEFTINLLDYYQGVEEYDSILFGAASTGGTSLSETKKINEKLIRVNVEAYEAELVLDSLKNDSLLGVEEAYKDVKAILAQADRGFHNSSYKDGALGWVTEQIARAKEFVENKPTSRSKGELVENFFNQSFVLDYQVRLRGLIDRVLSEEAFLNLEAFAKVKEEILEHKESIGKTTYPDFPLSELIDVIRGAPGDKGLDLLESLQKKLSNVNDQFVPGSKVVNLDTFFGPDYYLCGALQSQDEVLDKTKVSQASAAILDAFKNTKIQAVGGWLQNLVDEFSGPDKTKKIYKELTKTHEHMGISQADQIRALRANPAWVGNQQSGEALPDAGSIASTPVKDSKGMTQFLNSTTRLKNHTEIQGALRTLGEGDISGLTEEELEELGIPDFVWPTHEEVTMISTGYNPDGIGGRKHKGIDIVSKDPSIETYNLPIKAAAGGHIISITELGDSKQGKYTDWWDYTEAVLKETGWSAESQAKLKAKKIEYGSSGKMLRGGISIEIQHGEYWRTVYRHVKNDAKYESLLKRFKALKPGEKLEVQQGEAIATIGNTGRSTGPHLHFEIWDDNDEPVNPKELILEKKTSRNYSPDRLTERGSSPLDKSFNQLSDSIARQRGMINAYPTYKLYFIESDEGERHFFGFDDFFSYQSVQDIQLIKSANNPADLLIIKITNLAGYLTNRRFKDIKQNQNEKGKTPLQISPISGDSETGEPIRSEEDYSDLSRTDTEKENPISSLFLKEGTQIQLRLGYNPNPQELETVFDGLIMDIEFNGSDEVLTLVCQSFGMELAAGVIGLNDKEEFVGAEATSGKILQKLMTFPEVKHFGRWAPSAEEGGGGVEWKPWKLVREYADGNISPPVVGLGEQLNFTAYKTTIWDIAQELTYRHPGYIAYPAPYEGKWGPRMTFFFGLPSNTYVSRDATWTEKHISNLISLSSMLQLQTGSVSSDQSKELAELLDPTVDPSLDKTKELLSEIMPEKVFDNPWASKKFFWFAPGVNKYDHTKGLDFAIANKIREFTAKRGVLKPFRRYHLVSSQTNLISNNIVSSAYSTFNAATIEFSKNGATVEDEKLQFGTPDTLSVKADSLIPDEEIREIYAGFENCYGDEQAKRYAQALVWKSMKKGYRGSLTIRGNPEIRPHDICYLFDTYTDMYGPVEVEQVVHRFSHHTGFITEIVPMMCIHTNETATMPTMDVIGLLAEKHIPGITFFRETLPTVEPIAKTGVTALGMYIGGKAIAGTAIGKGAISLISGVGLLPVATVALTAGTALTAVALIYNFSQPDKPDERGSTGWMDDFGLFLGRKHITRTQMAQLLEYSPLVVRGRPLLGGISTRIKEPGSFIQTWVDGKLKWMREGKENRPLLDLEEGMRNNPENYPIRLRNARLSEE